MISKRAKTEHRWPGVKKKKAGKVKKCESIIINVEPGSTQNFFSNGKKNFIDETLSNYHGN